MRFLFHIRFGLALTIGVLTLLAFTGFFYPIPFLDAQLTALFQRILIDFSFFALILLLALLILTLLFGRLYCSVLCPLGLCQELLMLIRRRRVGVQKNYCYKYLIAVIAFCTLIGGTVLIIRLIDPYSLFGAAAGKTIGGLIALTALMLLVWFKGRFFCAQICPVGTILGLLSKHARNQIYIDPQTCITCGLCARKCPTGCIDYQNKTVHNETCVKCFKCLTACRQNSIRYGTRPSFEPAFDPTRRHLLVSAGIVGLAVLAAKGGVTLTRQIAHKIKNVILPAGAGNAADFANRCLNCNLCVQNCPMKILQKANAHYPAIHIDYGSNFCDYDCHKCATICPSGAIKRLTLSEKQQTQIALAVIDTNKCIKCGLCVMKCPRQIIQKPRNDFPQINPNGCIGCGTCQSTCPVQAIHMIPVENQRRITE